MLIEFHLFVTKIIIKLPLFLIRHHSTVAYANRILNVPLTSALDISELSDSGPGHFTFKERLLDILLLRLWLDVVKKERSMPLTGKQTKVLQLTAQPHRLC
jgi:hypothetical protein